MIYLPQVSLIEAVLGDWTSRFGWCSLVWKYYLRQCIESGELWWEPYFLAFKWKLSLSLPSTLSLLLSLSRMPLQEVVHRGMAKRKKDARNSLGPLHCVACAQCPLEFAARQHNALSTAIIIRDSPHESIVETAALAFLLTWQSRGEVHRTIERR